LELKVENKKADNENNIAKENKENRKKVIEKLKTNKE